VFHFSGYGRQIFRPEGPNEKDEAKLLAEEPLVGLMPSDATVSDKEIAEIGDLTSIHVRYWCNALYLRRGVRSVIILLDTSFSDPGPDYHKPDYGKERSAVAPFGGNKQEASVLRVRSHRPHLMTNECKTDLPESVQWPSWFNDGRALDDPADSLRVCDNLNDAPYYFGMYCSLVFHLRSIISHCVFAQRRVVNGPRATLYSRRAATPSWPGNDSFISPLKKFLEPRSL
jgi:hypothetical protein